MADNSRGFTAASSHKISRTDPTGMDPNAAHTFAAWVWVNSYGAAGRVIFRYGSAGISSRGVALFVNSTGVLRARVSTQSVDGATAIGTGAWVRVGFRRAGSGIAITTVTLNGADDGNLNRDPPVALNAGDVLQLSDTDSVQGHTHFDGRIAWGFWLQGVALTSAAQDTYLNNPQSLITDYGTSGGVTANALKMLWPCQCNNATELDKSGVANDGTYTGTSLGSADGPSPSTPWNPCAAAARRLARLVGSGPALLGSGGLV